MDIPFFKKLSLTKGLGFFGKEERVLGIDFGSSSLKVVQLRKEKERAILETYGEIACGPYGGAAVGKSVRLVDVKIIEMLKDVLKESNANATRAGVSIPLRASFVRTISVPLMSETELQTAVPFEARKYVPIPINEVVIDWWLLPQGVSGETGKEEGFVKERRFSDVLLVAIHRSLVEFYRSIFAQAGLQTNAFEIEVFSQVRSILTREVQPVLLVDLGAMATRFTMVDYGIVRLTHTVDRGSQELTEALSRSLGIDFERAERLKRDTGLSSRPEHKEILKVLEPLLDYIFSEGLHVIAEYHRRSGRPIKKVWLLGGGSMLKGIKELAINKFGIEVSESSPFSKVEYPAFLESTLKESGPIFATAIGAALRGLQ